MKKLNLNDNETFNVSEFLVAKVRLFLADVCQSSNERMYGKTLTRHHGIGFHYVQSSGVD